MLSAVLYLIRRNLYYTQIYLHFYNTGNKMETKFKIAFIPFDAFGHVNACIGLAQVLQAKGHKCVFIVGHTWKGKLSCYGFDEEIYVEKHKLGKDSSQLLNDFICSCGHTLSLSPFDKLRALEAPGWAPLIQDIKYNEPFIKQIIAKVKPDAIIVDHFITYPSVVSSGLPWIHLISCNQLYYINDERLPPGGSGYATNGDKKLWNEFRKEAIDAYDKDWNEFNTWIQSEGAEPLERREIFCNLSPYLNLYLTPEELDYTDIRPKPENWFNIDCLMRSEFENQTESFQIPEKLIGKPGKLIYLSMGTICCSELNLMKRLVSILSKSKNRFIVSKGPLGEKYELSDNMWGQNSLKQTLILPIVDLVITHSGNNTVTESLYFGKPMIALPLFCDQYNTAQRLVEKGLGIRLDPYNCSESQLLNAIDLLLADNDLKLRLEMISKRIKNSKSKANAVDRIQKLLIDCRADTKTSNKLNNLLEKS